MIWDMRLDEERRLVMVVASGSLRAGEVQRMIHAARAASREKAFDILYDLRAAIPGALGHGEVFWMARQLSEFRGRRNTRVATL